MKLIDQIYCSIEKAIIAEDEQLSLEELRKVLELITTSYNQIEDKSEFYYLIGYCWYLFPLDSLERRNNIVSHLQRSVSINPHNHFARLYLGHHYFDQNEFFLALKSFELVDLEYFASIEQKWRALKTTELILSCGMKVNNKLDVATALSLIKAYEELGAIESPLPTELIRSLSNFLKANKIDSDIKEVVDELSGLMLKFEITEIFEEEYLSLKQSC